MFLVDVLIEVETAEGHVVPEIGIMFEEVGGFIEALEGFFESLGFV